MELLSKVELPRSVRVHSAAEITDPPEIPIANMIKENDHIDFVPRDPQQLGALVIAIEQSGLRYDRMEIIGPNLETLFLQLTGKELRD